MMKILLLTICMAGLCIVSCDECDEPEISADGIKFILPKEMKPGYDVPMDLRVPRAPGQTDIIYKPLK